MKSYFDRVKRWNEKMGVKLPNVFRFPKESSLMRDLMVEEAEEMYDAETKEEVLDALADQQFVLWGNAARYGIKYDEFRDYVRKVMISNESKFAATKQDAVDSIESEAERLDLDPSMIDFKEVDRRYVIFNKETGKILKSIHYLSPEEVK